MRSRAEWTLRALALAALALLIWMELRPAPDPKPAAATAGALERTLVDATRKRVQSLAVELDSVPGAVLRDWLAAVRAAGTDVAWTARGLRPLAIASTRIPEPESRVRIAVAGLDSGRVVLADALGILDTVEAGAAPASRVLRTATGSLAASASGVVATAPVPAPVQVRRVKVLGSAGWESKFVISALEEAGWKVDARIRVAPEVETRQGSGLPLDTAGYSAVIALDGAAAASAGAIERYVNAGGGAILAGTATRAPGFARITPGSASARRLAGERPGFTLATVRSEAAVLESQGGAPMLAARRIGHGRVVASGYDETWKWRMRREADAPAVHREWWTALVSSVAFVPGTGAESAVALDPAPLAAVTAALGPPSELDPVARQDGARLLPAWLLFGVLLASLLGEVVLRRLRGLA